jgi:hypothetical protein
MRLTLLKTALAATAVSFGSTALACSPFKPAFFDLLERPAAAVVIGHYVPKANDETKQQYSNSFVVTEVLQGELKPQEYTLMMTGPWGNMCEQSTQKSYGPPSDPSKPIVVIVRRMLNANTLDLPFMHPSTSIVDGTIKTTRRYIWTKDERNPERPQLKYLQRPEQLTMSLTALKQWLRDDKKTPAPWQISTLPEKALN